MLYNWAALHPDQVARIAGIYTVCDLRSWPGLDKACGAYRMTAEQLAKELPQHNPIDLLAPLAKAKIPILHLHGDKDTVVPLEKNSGELARRYKALGASMELVVVPARVTRRSTNSSRRSDSRRSHDGKVGDRLSRTASGLDDDVDRGFDADARNPGELGPRLRGGPGRIHLRGIRGVEVAAKAHPVGARRLRVQPDRNGRRRPTCRDPSLRRTAAEDIFSQQRVEGAAQRLPVGGFFRLAARRAISVT
jgi:hypothetical protein